MFSYRVVSVCLPLTSVEEVGFLGMSVCLKDLSQPISELLILVAAYLQLVTLMKLHCFLSFTVEKNQLSPAVIVHWNFLS